MTDEVPLELLRLKSATKAYLAILHDSMMFLELHAATKKPADPTADDWPGILLRRVKASLLDSETPGTVAGIADALAVSGAPKLKFGSCCRRSWSAGKRLAWKSPIVVRVRAG